MDVGISASVSASVSGSLAGSVTGSVTGALSGAASMARGLAGAASLGLDLFKLEKLTITAFKDANRQEQSPGATFTAMFNPTSYTKSYASKIVVHQPPGAPSPILAYAGTAPSTLALTFTLDGTGVHDIGMFVVTGKTVAERVKEFLSVAYEYKGTLHEAHYLIVEWGSLIYHCRLAKADVTYTSFDRGGQPLRAEIKAEFIHDKSPEMIAQEAQLESPDVTHARIVRSGDTLPLLTKEIYGSSARYLDVARWNGLDDFRDLVPGQQIFFPPLASFEREAGAPDER